VGWEAGAQADQTAVALDFDGVAGRVDVGDDTSISVVEAEPRVVAPDHDVVAGRERAAGQVDLDAAESPGCAHVLASAGVEVVDVRAMRRDHQAGPRITARPPVRDELRAGILGCLGDPQSIVSAVQVEGMLRAAPANVSDGLPFPPLDLAAVVP
jgi:esterase/lipase superfamily enzyme